MEITLFGPAWRHYAWALAALVQALATGVGRRRTPWRVVQAARVRPGGLREPLALVEGRIRLPADLSPDLLGLAFDPFVAARPLAVEFASPARLLRDGKLLPGAEPVPFGLLVARLLDRFADLYCEAASEALRPEIRAVVEAEAAAVPTLEDDTRWIEARDYSARHDAEMLLGGKVGRAVYGPEAARFLPLLFAGEVLHVGKNTASGCGRLRVEVL